MPVPPYKYLGQFKAHTLVGPSALLCFIFQMLSDFSSKEQMKGQSPDVKYASAKLNHQVKQTMPMPGVAV